MEDIIQTELQKSAIAKKSTNCPMHAYRFQFSATSTPEIRCGISPLPPSAEAVASSTRDIAHTALIDSKFIVVFPTGTTSTVTTTTSQLLLGRIAMHSVTCGLLLPLQRGLFVGHDQND